MGSSVDKVSHRPVLQILKSSLTDPDEIGLTSAGTNTVMHSWSLSPRKNSYLKGMRDLSAENEVRYKLLIDTSEDESLIRFLFDFGVLERLKTRIYVCSNFPGDLPEQKVSKMLHYLCNIILLKVFTDINGAGEYYSRYPTFSHKRRDGFT